MVKKNVLPEQKYISLIIIKLIDFARTDFSSRIILFVKKRPILSIGVTNIETAIEHFTKKNDDSLTNRIVAHTLNPIFLNPIHLLSILYIQSTRPAPSSACSRGGDLECLEILLKISIGNVVILTGNNIPSRW